MANALLWLSLLGSSALTSALDTSGSTPTIRRADAGNTSSSSIPTATLNNTVFVGRSLPEFEQELFLGIKFADEPVRFTPSTLKTAYRANDSDNGVYHGSGLQASSGTAVLYNATEYGYDCPGYGSDETKLAEEGYARFDEDCMNLNVIRPKRENKDELLPVMIWIFGGGWVQGATADPRYDL